MTGNRSCNDLTVKELKGSCKVRGVKKYSRKRKRWLVRKCCFPHGKETSEMTVRSKTFSKSSAVASFSFERRIGRPVGYTENPKASSWRLDNHVLPTDELLYLRKKATRNVAMDGVIRERKTSEHLRLADDGKTLGYIPDFSREEVALLGRLSSVGIHGRPNPYTTNKNLFCNLKSSNSKELDLSNRDLDRVPGCISKFKEIERLELNENNIKTIDGLDDLEKLKELSLRSNNVNRIDGLWNLEKLEILTLTDNEIEKIEGLDSLDDLKELHLTKNDIKSIGGLDNLKSLKKLMLPSNEIDKMEGIDKLVNLEELNLALNHIKKIEKIDKFVNLKKLYLNFNEITTLGDSIFDLARSIRAKRKKSKDGRPFQKLIINLLLAGNDIPEKQQESFNRKYLDVAVIR
jgi:Leucine-rich repeat (LRR) protein